MTEKCFCGAEATRKIEESIEPGHPAFGKPHHPYTSYICEHHWNVIFHPSEVKGTEIVAHTQFSQGEEVWFLRSGKARNAEIAGIVVQITTSVKKPYSSSYEGPKWKALYVFTERVSGRDEKYEIPQGGVFATKDQLLASL